MEGHTCAHQQQGHQKFVCVLHYGRARVVFCVSRSEGEKILFTRDAASREAVHTHAWYHTRSRRLRVQLATRVLTNSHSR